MSDEIIGVLACEKHGGALEIGRTEIGTVLAPQGLFNVIGQKGELLRLECGCWTHVMRALMLHGQEWLKLNGTRYEGTPLPLHEERRCRTKRGGCR